MLRQQLAAKMLRHERWDARSCFLHRSLESRMKYVSDIRAKQFRELSQYEFFKSCVRRFCARSGWHWSWPPARCVLKLLSHIPLKFTASLKKQWTRNPVFFFYPHLGNKHLAVKKSLDIYRICSWQDGYDCHTCLFADGCHSSYLISRLLPRQHFFILVILQFFYHGVLLNM